MANPALNVVKGFLIAEYSDHEAGRHTFSNPADFEKVRLGYACAYCLAEFTCYMAKCPLCGNERDVARDMQETPSDVQAYYDESTSSGEATVARSMPEAIRELLGDTDTVEHIPLSKLRPRRPRG